MNRQTYNERIAKIRKGNRDLRPLLPILTDLLNRIEALEEKTKKRGRGRPKKEVKNE